MPCRFLGLVVLVVLARPAVALPEAPASAATARPQAVVAAVAELKRLFEDYLQGGRPAAKKRAILDFFGRTDRAMDGDAAADYWLQKARHLGWLGEPEAGRAALERVPDDALVDPADVAGRLAKRTLAEPQAALRLAQRLADSSDLKARLELLLWVHEGLAQAYAPAWQASFKDEAHAALLAGLGDPAHPFLAQATAGLRLFAAALRVADDPAALAPLAAGDFGGDFARPARYRLLLARLLERHAALRGTAEALRERVIVDQERALPALEADPRPNPWQERERAAGRAALAGAYAARALAARLRGDAPAAEAALGEAARVSPDARDAAHGFQRIEAFVLGGPPEYRAAYAERLEARGALEAALEVRAALARVDPTRLDDLRALYARLHPGGSFDRFWQEALLSGRPPAPELDLPTPDGGTLRLSDYRGRWVLLDFWGTWCGPCRAESPRLEALHRESLEKNGGRTQVLTVACDDTLPAVRAWMRDQGLTFPVAMARDETAAQFGVSQYPTKRLVSPDGRLVELLHPDRWEEEARLLLGLAPRD